MPRVLIFGNGRSGKAAAALLAREGREAVVLEGADAFPATPRPAFCVTSPGIPPNHPWRVAARAAGIPVVSELQLGAERYRAAGGRMLAVTGSKGKSSVVKLVAEALGGVPCGNYGKPLCEVVREACGGALPMAVVEVSSFQLETTDLPGDTFVAAAILNLQEDHIDRHGTVAAYHALKRKLLTMSRVRISGADGTVRAENLPAAATSAADAALLAGSYFDNPVLRVNGLCAVALMRAAGLDAVQIAAAFRAFKPLPHRMQIVRESEGTVWIDDSKATSVAALIAGVTMAAARRPAGTLRLIAGGLAKGDNPADATICLQRNVGKVYLIGHCADQFRAAWEGIVTCEMCGTMRSAVAAVKRDLCAGDCVLLSPGTASFDQFKSYGERGDAFAECATEG